MHIKRQMVLWVGVCWALLASASGTDTGNSELSLEDWKRERVAFLKSADGYLNLVGLYWLRKPHSTFGSAPGSDIRFPAGSPAQMGEFLLQDDSVVLQVADGVEVFHRGKIIRSVEMHDDTTATVTREGAFPDSKYWA